MMTNFRGGTFLLCKYNKINMPDGNSFIIRKIVSFGEIWQFSLTGLSDLEDSNGPINEPT